MGGFRFKGARFKPHPFEIVQAYDIDAKCVETYKQNISHNIQLADLSILGAADAPAADVLIGGFPCQDFSSCGPKKGLNSPRGKLYKALSDYMTIHQPLVVVGENVPHLARMNNGEILRTIKEDLEKTGYRVAVWDLYGPNFGIPQNRSRLFLVCVRNDIHGEPVQPKPTFKSERYRTIDWAIGDLIRITRHETVPNQSQYFVASRAKNGNGQGDETSKRGQPGYTVRANAKSRVQFHYVLERRLTIRECARLQTFPDTFVFPHSATTNIMQIGNAVPPVLAYRVASSIARFLKSHPNHK
jgi:DNA (cytosine-5)-methyltransferase 1